VLLHGFSSLYSFYFNRGCNANQVYTGKPSSIAQFGKFAIRLTKPQNTMFMTALLARAFWLRVGFLPAPLNSDQPNLKKILCRVA
jgi:hypothetical protein